MDITQIGLGLGLLAVSSLTLVGPSMFDTDVVTIVMGGALLLGSVAVLASVARDARLS
ncbi:hypothetical protein [Natrarchaeobius halalkaliphilus]|uniref:hypothetical protein n=1 Tax=Natrarchaeobius halalkaliphilus TaxID=1679091 RepID=UPI0014047A64|nr:hypothetical protein [Natrarchaeobius halalkaliphilus]